MAAWRYWLNVFPHVHHELRQWQRRACMIPDHPLRQVALAVQRTKRGNIEGSAAFAAFAPRAHRQAVLRAQIAFQAIYDYVDTLAEQPHADPIRNARQLHSALLAALDLDAPAADYYRHHTNEGDAGYLLAILGACRAALTSLPAYPAVAAPARQLTERIVGFQSLNLTQAQGSYHALAHWAHQQTPPESGLWWWEIAASAGSSLGIFALMASAARADIHPGEATAIARAYFPWIGSLHSLLDNLIDHPEDTATEQHNLIEHYGSAQETATRLRALALQSARQTHTLPRGRQHDMILAGMASHYLSTHEANLPHAQPAKAAVLEAIGGLAGPTMLVFSLRRAVARAVRGF